MLFDLPVETIADLISLLNVREIIVVSQVSRHLRFICQDPLLNPWRRPILRLLMSQGNLDALKNLSVYSVVPRQNFIEILSLAPPHFILMEVTPPHLKKDQWSEVLARRFLPSWRNARYSDPREQYMRILWSVWHRLNSNCNTQAWCNYLVIGRNGTIHNTAAYTRTYDPLVVLQDLKTQADLAHLPTQIRVVLQLEDVRILALGTLHRATSFWINRCARSFLHPPGVEAEEFLQPEELTMSEKGEPADLEEVAEAREDATELLSELHPTLSRESANSLSRGTVAARLFGRERSWSGSPIGRTSLFRTRSLEEKNAIDASPSSNGRRLMRLLTRASRDGAASTQTGTRVDGPLPEGSVTPASGMSPITSPLRKTFQEAGEVVRESNYAPYPPLQHPLPVREFANYPNFTPGGVDTRWKGYGEAEEDGLVWAGPMLLTAQITGQRVPAYLGSMADSLLSPGKFAPLGVDDLKAIAPWMQGKWGKISFGDGPVLGT